MASCSRVALRSAEDDALEECMLVMKPCDPAAPDPEDECIDEEALQACTDKSEAQAREELAAMGDQEKNLMDGSY